jgi:uncharacterized membrane protein
MNRVVQIVVLSIVATLLVLGVMGVLLPTHYHVQRAILINAPATAVHPWVEDLRRWPTWANWNRVDPTLTATYSNVTQGVGARETWRSERSGSGTREITRSDPHTGIEFSTELGDGIPCKGSVRYSESAGTTTVTWTDEGQLPGLVGGFSKGAFEDTLGEHMAEGLKRLKQAVEKYHAQSGRSVHP